MTDESKATGNQPVDLLELITYQKKSVVSRQILKRKSGTITLFAFDKDEGLSEHTAPFEAFIFVLEGMAEVTINKEAFIVKENESIILPANIPHAVKAPEQFKMLLVMLRAE
ncbi:cupin domain-containing protein [Candidatus Heimdallarchaeota archaeon]|nr:MAG: cupin domain-containing protein [Candidatus Heimdallarchaeota archaeon]